MNKIKDWFLNLLEVYGSKISCWAWDKRWAKRDSNEWIKGYKKWKEPIIRNEDDYNKLKKKYQ